MLLTDQCCLQPVVLAEATISATAFTTWLCHQRQRPLPRTFGQLLRMCSSNPVIKQRGQTGISLIPQMWRLAGFGTNSLYKEPNTVVLSLQDVSPGNSALYCRLTPLPCSLRLKAHHPTGSYFLHTYSNLTLDQVAYLHILWAFSTGILGRQPSSAQPLAAFPTRALCFSLDCATSSVLTALHFLAVLTTMPTDDTLESLNSLY